MKRLFILVLAISAAAMLIGCGPSALDITPQIEAARSAVQQARDEQAPEYCPDEFQSAEMKLKQMEILVGDEEIENAQVAAGETVNLANLARNCAIARKQHVENSPALIGPPEELKNFKVSVYFDFNSNAIPAGERNKLNKAAAFLKKMAKDHRFYILLSAYADPPGTAEDNLELAARRALVVRYVLAQNGVARSRIYMRSLGHEIALRDLSDGYGTEVVKRKKDQKWRRVDINVIFEHPAAMVTGE